MPILQAYFLGGKTTIRMRRSSAIQEHLLDLLATKLLAVEFKPGDQIKVGVDGEHLAFKAKQLSKVGL